MKNSEVNKWKLKISLGNLNSSSHFDFHGIHFLWNFMIWLMLYKWKETQAVNQGYIICWSNEHVQNVKQLQFQYTFLSFRSILTQVLNIYLPNLSLYCNPTLWV